MNRPRTAHIDSLTADKIKGFDHFVIDAYGLHLGEYDRPSGITNDQLALELYDYIWSVSPRDINICNITIYLYKANNIVN